MKYIFINLLAVALGLVYTNAYGAGDISVISMKVTYKDDVTVPGKVIMRELTSLHDDTFWSKPTNVDVTVEIENKGSESANYITVTPELFYLVKPEKTRFPPMKRELSTITNEPTWVWIRTLESDAVRELKAGEQKKLVFTGLDVRNTYYATSYQVQAYAIRVFVEARVGGDNNYSNNVKEWIVRYGD